MKKFYITAAIPYVNAKPHIGHALEFVQADVIKRYHKLLEDETLLLSGGDENALKNVQAAENANTPVQEFVDKNTKAFYDVSKKLNVNFDVFQKGSDPKHHLSSQKLWELCAKNGDIYKKEYTGLYCVGCEAFYEVEELNEKGECFEHPGRKLEKVTEENYFFKLSKYQDQIKELIEKDKIKIIPQKRKNEALAFIKQGLQDISISRSNERAKNWGVQVPNDKTQRMYVWFDALNIYQSGVGFGADERSEGARLQGEAEDKRGSLRRKKHVFTEKDYEYWWPADLHVIGKGIIRFHAIYWPAFLLSANLKLPKSIFVHGYFTVNGQKMSKTLGNVIDPIDMIEKYGTDALRYYLLKEIPSTEDGDFSESKLKEVYNSDLANGLGNLVARVLALAMKYSDGKVPKIDKDLDSHPLRINKDIHNWKNVWEDIDRLLPEYKFNEVLESVWKFINTADKYINDNKPWELATKDKEEFNFVLYGLLDSIHQIAWQIYPFLPETALEIGERLGIEKLKTENPLYKDSFTNIKPGTKIKQGLPLFPRI